MAKKAIKKSAAKKAAKTTATTKAVKKAAKKVPVKKAAVEKAPTKKAAKKAPNKAAVKKTATAKPTTVLARVDVGFGNAVFIRGEGSGLSWDTGVEMDNVSALEWAITLEGPVTYKLLLNDEQWAEGENISADAGSVSETAPVFV